jgi:hypothetical protein
MPGNPPRGGKNLPESRLIFAIGLEKARHFRRAENVETLTEMKT